MTKTLSTRRSINNKNTTNMGAPAEDNETSAGKPIPATTEAAPAAPTTEAAPTEPAKTETPAS
jgi:hypothetical protein